MGLHDTEALVLRSYALAEADRIVVLLTREQGIVRGVAKGAKRLNSRFGSTLEPFTVIRVEYFQTPERELVSIRRAEIVESLFETASDPEILPTLAYFSDVLTAFSQPADPDDRLYRMTRRCISALATQTKSAEPLVAYFEHWVLKLGGFLPSWRKCSHCARELDANEDAAIRADFRLSCASCERIRQQNRLPPELRALRALAEQLPPERFAAETADRVGLVAELSSILKRIVAAILGRGAGVAAEN